MKPEQQRLRSPLANTRRPVLCIIVFIMEDFRYHLNPIRPTNISSTLPTHPLRWKGRADSLWKCKTDLDTVPLELKCRNNMLLHSTVLTSQTVHSRSLGCVQKDSSELLVPVFRPSYCKFSICAVLLKLLICPQLPYCCPSLPHYAQTWCND